VTRGELERLLADKLGYGTVPAGTGLESLYAPAVAVRPGSPYRIYLAACRSQTVSIELIVCPADNLDAWDKCDEMVDGLLDVLEACEEVGDVSAEGAPATVDIANRLFWTVPVTATLL